MASIPINTSNGNKFIMPFHEILKNHEDLKAYQELIISICTTWENGKDLNSQNRIILWKNLFMMINQFIFKNDTNLINFERCLSVGALIFTFDLKKTYIFAKLSYFQNLFQRLPKPPNKSTILKKFGKISSIETGNINILFQFQNFLNGLVKQFPEANCNYGWSLYELNYELPDAIVLKSDLLINSFEEFNQKILDSILDDAGDIFSELLKKYLNAKDYNQVFKMKNFRLPEILLNNPSYASLCCFFSAEICFSTLCNLIFGGINSEQMKTVDDNGRNLLHFACAGGNLRIINQLVQAGLDINSTDFDGLTPCHYAAMNGSVSVFHYLWNKGADICSFSSEKIVPFHIACIYGNVDILKLINEKTNYAILKNFLCSNQNECSLCLASQNGNDNVVRYLLNEINQIKNEIGNIDSILFMALLCACQNGSLSCVKLLFDHNDDLLTFIKTSEKSSLLYNVAKENGHKDIIQYLFLRGIIIKNDCQQEFPKQRNYRAGNDEQINKNFVEILTSTEKENIEFIKNHFQAISKMTNKDYYCFINSLIAFNNHEGTQKSLQCSAVSGIIPSLLKIDYNGKYGTIIAINEDF